MSTELYPGSLDTVTVADDAEETDVAPLGFPPPPQPATHSATAVAVAAMSDGSTARRRLWRDASSLLRGRRRFNVIL